MSQTMKRSQFKRIEECLDEFIAAGLIRQWYEPAPEGGSPRVVVALTELGRKASLSEVKRLLSTPRPKDA